MNVRTAMWASALGLAAFGAAACDSRDTLAPPPAAPGGVAPEDEETAAWATAAGALEEPPTADKTGAAAAAAAQVEPMGPVRPTREFTCDPTAVEGVADISDVRGVEGATLAIRPSRELCQYHLYYRASGSERRLSSHPGGYLVATAGVAREGRAVACASNIEHRPDPTVSVSADEPLPRWIERVPIECTTRAAEGEWTPLQRVLDGGHQWAAWVVELQQSDRDPQKIRLVWMRDFSFQFLNLSNEGRPLEDGVYATDFRVDSRGRLVTLATTRLSDIIPPENVSVEPWEPSPQDDGKIPGVPARLDSEQR